MITFRNDNFVFPINCDNVDQIVRITKNLHDFNNEYGCGKGFLKYYPTETKIRLHEDIKELYGTFYINLGIKELLDLINVMMFNLSEVPFNSSLSREKIIDTIVESIILVANTRHMSAASNKFTDANAASDKTADANSASVSASANAAVLPKGKESMVEKSNDQQQQPIIDIDLLKQLDSIEDELIRCSSTLTSLEIPDKCYTWSLDIFNASKKGYLTNLKTIKNYKCELKFLRFLYGQIEDLETKHVYGISSFSSLKSLTLMDIDDEYRKDYSEIAALRNTLEVLVIGNGIKSNMMPFDITSPLCTLSKLRSITFGDDYNGSIDGLLLSPSFVENLEELSFGKKFNVYDHFKNITKLKNLKKLCISLSSNVPFFYDACSANNCNESSMFICNLQHLQCYNIGNTNNSYTLSSVHSLVVKKASAKEMYFICSRFPNLKYLCIYDCNLSNDGSIFDFSKLEPLTSLKKLHIFKSATSSSCRLTNFMTWVNKMQNLEDLHISTNMVDNINVFKKFLSSSNMAEASKPIHVSFAYNHSELNAIDIYNAVSSYTSTKQTI